jgi:cell division transport system ATP-binding protein
MIQLNQISKRYSSGQLALSQLSFRLETGEFAFLTGHSGAGKSTLLKLIALLIHPSAGEIFVNGVNLRKITAGQIPFMRRQIGIIFQNPHLLADRNVFENVALPLYLEGYSYKDVGRRVRAALDKVALLYKEKSLPENLSCGEQQRVNIARAIVSRPSILVADEPTGNLDPELAKTVMQLFEQFHQIGTTTLIASHDLPLIHAMQHRILKLENGQLVCDFT